MVHLFHGCVAALTDFQERYPLWFLGVPLARIRRGNVREWLAWAFYCKHVEEFDVKSEENELLEELVNVIEKRSGHSFPEGKEEGVKCCRLNLDPVKASGRPLILYVVS